MHTLVVATQRGGLKSPRGLALELDVQLASLTTKNTNVDLNYFIYIYYILVFVTNGDVGVFCRFLSFQTTIYTYILCRNLIMFDKFCNC